ncbi:hypothetical protein Actkin_03281 [Actinokineospora sp. UTMC 2448]|nr:hypothetical protein Actkin_03281 [Actinokineospora sp. UTMC 2448]
MWMPDPDTPKEAARITTIPATLDTVTANPCTAN